MNLAAPTRNGNPKSEIVGGPTDVLDHATSEIAIGSKLGIDATKKLPGEGFKRSWPLIKMDEAVKAKVEILLADERMQSACFGWPDKHNLTHTLRSE